MNKRLPVIIDTDIGSDIDDTFALALLLASDRFDVKLIMTVCEDVQYKASLVMKICDRFGLDIPVAAGVGGKVECSAQQAWLGEYKAEVNTDYIGAFERAVTENPDITVIGLAPLTNLANILSLKPQLAEKFRLTAMIGSIYKGYLGFDKACAECNAALDPHAYNAVTRAVRAEILPLDVCRDFILTGDGYAALKRSTSVAARTVMENYLVWQRDYKGGAVKHNPEISSGVQFDMLPVLRLLYPEYFQIQRLKIECDEVGNTLISDNGAAVDCCIKCDKDKLLELAAKILTGEERHDG